MIPHSRRGARLPLVSLLAISSAFAAGERLTFDPTQFSTGNFHGCSSIGQGSDPYLNSLKNRDDGDKYPTTVRLYTVAKLVAAAPKNLPKRRIHREKWTAQQQDLAARWESRAVMVEGYLIKAKREGKEACNCGSTEYVDHHLWLASTSSSTARSAMVVEVSPRSWDTHPDWNKTATFKNLVDSKTKVRVTGWLTWDQEHAEQLGVHRKTLWEVHPVHSIQVLKGSEWVAL